MSRRRLLWQLYSYSLVIVLLSLLAVAWYASDTMRQFYYECVGADLESRAHLIESRIQECLSPVARERMDAFCKAHGAKAATRITVILPTGEVIGDSDEDPSRMENHADRPEIIEALAGDRGQSVRYSNTLRKDMMYVAIPVRKDGHVAGVLRTSVPLTFIGKALKAVYGRIALGGVVIAVFAAVVSLIVSRRITKPLEEIRQGAERFAQGELDHRLPGSGTEEIDGLADTMNQMARQLAERITTISRQRSELDAVLTSMVEGVIAVDSEERVISLNQAAARLMEVDASEACGRSVREVLRVPDLQRFISKALSGEGPVEGEITLHGNGERFFQAHATSLRYAQGHETGALVVLNDVTRLRKLERIRRDFVANVSHELRTPITSIKGFVETLQDGALESPEDARRFLGIIGAQADRLNAIIEDLLSLSRIEQETEKSEIELEPLPIRDVLEAAIQTCSRRASARDMQVSLRCKADISARINPQLLEQAVVNLIDNAIKYSDPGTSVLVDGAQSDSEVTINVRDKGCGIDEEHIARLFERFYRVDKARSRELGGTGLGLAIVKHIAQAHGGRIGVESKPGKGSTFTICLPHV